MILPSAGWKLSRVEGSGGSCSSIGSDWCQALLWLNFVIIFQKVVATCSLCLFLFDFFFLTETVSEDSSGASTGHTTKSALKDQIYCGMIFFTNLHWFDIWRSGVAVAFRKITTQAQQNFGANPGRQDHPTEFDKIYLEPPPIQSCNSISIAQLWAYRWATQARPNM